MDYKLIVAKDDWYTKVQIELEKKVKEHIVKGWEPLGGVSVSMVKVGYGSTIVLAQAMIKR